LKKLILASGSPRRRELMKLMGVNFEICESSWNEENLKETLLSPVELCTGNALQKARNVSIATDKCIIIGCDTIVVLKKEILGKPSGKEEAREMLSKLSNKSHTVYSGLAVIDRENKKEITDCVATKVKFRKLTPGEINSYVETGEPLDKAGAYGIQGRGGLLVEKIDGCYYNVVGLPLTALYKILSKLNINVWS